MAIQHIGKENFVESPEEGIYLDHKGYALVDFWAEWCGPCKMYAPQLERAEKTLEKLAEEGKMEAVAVFKYDIEQEGGRDISRDVLRVLGIPSTILFYDGVEVDRFTGIASEKQLVRWVQEKIAEHIAERIESRINRGGEENGLQL